MCEGLNKLNIRECPANASMAVLIVKPNNPGLANVVKNIFSTPGFFDLTTKDSPYPLLSSSLQEKMTERKVLSSISIYKRIEGELNPLHEEYYEALYGDKKLRGGIFTYSVLKEAYVGAVTYFILSSSSSASELYPALDVLKPAIRMTLHKPVEEHKRIWETFKHVEDISKLPHVYQEEIIYSMNNGLHITDSKVSTETILKLLVSPEELSYITSS